MMTNQKITPEYVRELRRKITEGPWIATHFVSGPATDKSPAVNKKKIPAIQKKPLGALEAADADFIAAAPDIADAYLELAEDDKRLLGIIANRCARDVVEMENNRGNVQFTPQEMESLKAAMLADQEELELMRKENARLHAIIAQQRDALEDIKSFPRPAPNSNQAELVGRLSLVIDIATEALAAAQKNQPAHKNMERGAEECIQGDGWEEMTAVEISSIPRVRFTQEFLRYLNNMGYKIMKPPAPASTAGEDL